MGLSLRKRETALITFRRDLPEFLADGAPCFIEIHARPGGPINPDYVARMEAVALRGRIADRKLAREDDDKAHVEAEHAGRRQIGREMIGAAYDACVIEWRSNIMDGDAPIVCDRERFMALADLVGAPEISRAIAEFHAEVIAAGRAVAEADRDTEKN